MALDNNWFSEICEESATAFSLQVSEKLHEEQTPYQKIEIYETKKFGTLMVIDGFIMLSDRDNFLYHEMIAHPVIFTHANPEQVLIIGGGDCGTLREVLRHDGVKKASQVEIDERVTRLSEQYFPELCSANHDPRAEIVFSDGIKWVHDAEPQSLDIIIIDSTDPIGPAEGLFSAPFYKQCHRALKPNGLLVQQSESPLIHMRILKDMYKAMRGSGFIDIKTLGFPQPVYPTGWWSATIASKDKPIAGFREQDVLKKKFETQYYNAQIHRACFAMPEFFQRQIRS
ncbi:MAG: polyamine aminopropyltransferase [Gammaproteobacteria bacterium]|nr:polyamine aminopropyltransferase [Gammaproteobacteria bacterium]